MQKKSTSKKNPHQKKTHIKNKFASKINLHQKKIYTNASRKLESLISGKYLFEGENKK